MGRIPTIYYCSYENCTASYDRKHRYETHIRSHTGERPFICSHEGCEKKFASSCHLKRHEDTHGSSYRCTEEGCTEILKTKTTLKKHIKKVHLKIKQKVYTCNHCGKEFSKHNTLQRHELRHTGQLPHKCSVEGCEKAFLTPSKLKRHMKVHEGYPCKILGCDKIFEKWTLYVQHVRDFHRPEYKCQVCSKVFSTSYALKLHAPLHEESRFVYPCEVPNCSRYYFAERNLKWHMKKYHAKRPFMCDKENCHRAFKTESDLAEHILYHGKKKPRKKKNKPKKPKPSLAEILSGVAEVKEMNREYKQILTEEGVKPDNTVSSSNLNLNNLKLDTTEPSFIDSLELLQSHAKEKTPSALVNEKTINCVPLNEGSSFESSQLNTSSEVASTFSSNEDASSGLEESIDTRPLPKENTLETDQSTIVEVLDSECSTENYIAPMECEIDSSSTKLKVQEFTLIEVVDHENLSQFISVPVVQIDHKHWNNNLSVHIKTV